MLPPIVKAQASVLVGAPKDGARPPAAGPACGASGESPTPLGRGEPGRAATAGLGSSSASTSVASKLAADTPRSNAASRAHGTRERTMRRRRQPLDPEGTLGEVSSRNDMEVARGP